MPSPIITISRLVRIPPSPPWSWMNRILFHPSSLLPSIFPPTLNTTGMSKLIILMDWSAPGHPSSFRTALPAPLSLNANGVIQDLRPRLYLGYACLPIPDATSYTLQVSRNNTFTQVVQTGTTASMNYIPTSDLPRNAALFWHVHANGANGPSVWSDFSTYGTGNPPSTPSLLAPPSNTLVGSYTPMLDWSDTLIPSGAASFNHYVLQIADNAGFSDPLMIQTKTGEISNSSGAPTTALPSNTTWYWHVQACNTIAECSSWSSVRTFRTALPAPVGLAADGSVQDLRPNLSWAMPAYPFPNATGYSLQVSKNSTFTQIVSTWTVTRANYTPSSDLPRSLTLYWHVRASGANGPGAWSDFGTYTTGNPPSIPALTAPANNALTTNYTPLLEWSNFLCPPGTRGLRPLPVAGEQYCRLLEPVDRPTRTCPGHQFEFHPTNCADIQYQIFLARAGLQYQCRVQRLVVRLNLPDSPTGTAQPECKWCHPGPAAQASSGICLPTPSLMQPVTRSRSPGITPSPRWFKPARLPA